MSIKSFLTKKVLQMKGVSSLQAENIVTQLEKNPELTDALKTLESNEEVKELFEKIQKEIEEKKKSGTPEMYASMLVMSKYKTEVAKHKDVLEPIMRLMQR
jgi:cell fate (sporulation/competence/biofilm development) regulator YlbF (YheA/YmcA/DUF963 family)